MEENAHLRQATDTIITANSLLKLGNEVLEI